MQLKPHPLTAPPAELFNCVTAGIGLKWKTTQSPGRREELAQGVGLRARLMMHDTTIHPAAASRTTRV